MQGEKIKDETLDAAVFGVTVKPSLIQQAVVAQQANKRSVIAHAKDRSAVAGGGRKPWRQKGTGRARHGSSRSPIWRGGGITFGPGKDRNFDQKINRKMKRKAILMCLSDKAANDKIRLLEELSIPEPKTKLIFAILQNLSLRPKNAKASQPASKTTETEKKTTKRKRKKAQRVLVILPKSDASLQRSLRNIPAVTSISANSLNVVDLLRFDTLLMPLATIGEIKKTFVR